LCTITVDIRSHHLLFKNASPALVRVARQALDAQTSSGGRGMGFTADVRRDIRRAVRMGARLVDYLFELSTWIVLSYRVGHAIAGMPLPWRRALRLVHGPIHGILQIAGGIELPVNAKIGGGLHLRHTNGVVVHPEAEVGMDCNLSQGVTIGIGGRGERRGVPRVGDRVYFGPGAKVFGPIVVGDDVAIGANSVVNRDVPPRAVAVGVPFRVVSLEGSFDLVVTGDEGSASASEPQRSHGHAA